MSAKEPGTRPAWLSTPLYAFDIPRELVSSLVLRQNEEEVASTETKPSPPASAPPVETVSSAPRIGAPACSMCPGCGSFDNVQQQRSHFRSLWHRYNLVVKQHHVQMPSAAASVPLVSREELDQMCATLEDDDESPDELTALLRRLDLSSHDTSQEAENHARTVRIMSDALRSPIWWYETSKAAEVRLEQTQLGIYRDVLHAAAPPDAKPSTYLASLSTPRLTMRPGTYGWSGKRVHGTQHVGRAMQMHVLDGQGLFPHETGDESLDSDSDWDMSMDESESSVAPSSDEEDSSRAMAPLPPLRLWTFIMMGGGHFAIATVALNLHVMPQSERAKARGTKPQRSVLVVAHKTFHRYTTRRKQGGAQSAQDATGRHAKSAGANLRRYGEAQLTKDIHTLLGHRRWRDLIERSEHVWIRTSMRSAHGVLWQWPGHDTSPLDAKQAQGALSHIPIATQRPTIGEIMRCFFELVRVKVAHLTPEDLAAQDDAHRHAMARALRVSDAQQHQQQRPPTRPARPARRDAKESHIRERWERLVTMVRRGKLDALVNFIQRHNDMLQEALTADTSLPAYASAQAIDAPLPLWWRESQARGSMVPTNLLQLAAASDQADIVHFLLVEERADPTLPVAAALPHHRTAYDLCPSKSTRAVFRRLMAEQPTWCRWDEMGQGGARVPSALTAEMEEAQSSKTRHRRAAMRDKMRERDARAEVKPADTPPAPAPVSTLGHLWQRLGGSAPAEDASLSDDMRRRIEREKRARAAEARMQRNKS